MKATLVTTLAVFLPTPGSLISSSKSAGTSTNYASLQEAINAAVDAAINHNQYNSRITLLKDTEGTLDLSNIETTRSLRIDLEFNRKTFTATDTIKLDQDISLQINNGTITSTDNVNTLVEISDNHSELSFRNDVTVDATKLKTGGYIANVTGGRVNLFGKVNSDNATIKIAGGSVQTSNAIKADILLSGSNFSNSSTFRLDVQ